jgi:hypothetical protein
MATVFDRLCALKDCLCEQVKQSGKPVGFCQIVPGEAAASTYFECARDGGMAWVRLNTMYPVVSVGTPNTALGNCGSELGFDVEIGIMRCMPIGTSMGAGPSPKQLHEAAALQILDAHTLFRAVYCCDSIHAKDYRAGQYQPLGPEGGVVGGILTISMV